MINLFAPLNSLGIGVHSYNMAKAIESRGHEIAIFPPFGNVNRRGDDINRWLSAREKFSPKNPSLMIFDSSFFPHFSGSPRIGFSVTETNAFTPIQLAAIKSCDVILTPSKWGQSVLQRYGIESFVVNEGVDLEIYGRQPANATGDHPMTFVHVGKFEERKGTMQVLRCFFNALENYDATLLMHCENIFMNNWLEEIASWLYSRGFSPQQMSHLGSWRRAGLVIEMSPNHEEDLFNMYFRADCGIFPSKGEGWGLPINECLASGTPAIAGCWSGQSEYLRDDSLFSLKRYRIETANDNVWFHGDRGEWYVPYDDELINNIKHAFYNARNFKASAQNKMLTEYYRTFTWDRAAGQLEKVFDNLNLKF